MSQNQQPGQVPPYPGAQPPPPADAPARKEPRNTIGIVALVTAILGFIFAIVEGAYLLGWILLPIAFVLSLVALFQKGRSKRAAIAALILAIVGTIAGTVAFMGSVGRAFESAAGGPVTAAPVQAPAANESSQAPASDAPKATEQGTRENPYPLGATVGNEDWQVTVNSFTPDATKEVLAENQFNDEPEAGHQYALANITVTRMGSEATSPMFEVSVNYVTAAGNVVTSSDAMVVEPKPLSNNELYQGAEATGNVALQVPEGDAGLLRIKLGIFGGDDVFFAIA